MTTIAVRTAGVVHTLVRTETKDGVLCAKRQDPGPGPVPTELELLDLVARCAALSVVVHFDQATGEFQLTHV